MNSTLIIHYLMSRKSRMGPTCGLRRFNREATSLADPCTTCAEPEGVPLGCARAVAGPGELDELPFGLLEPRVVMERHAQMPTPTTMPAAMHTKTVVGVLERPALFLSFVGIFRCFVGRASLLSGGVKLAVVLRLLLGGATDALDCGLAGLGVGLSFGAAIAGGGICNASCRS